MKKTILIILTLFSINSFSQKITDAYLSYNLTLTMESSANNELLKSLYEEAENKEDSLMIEKISEGLLEAVKKLNNLSSQTDIFIYPDSVFIKTIDSDIIFIPEKFKKNRILRKGEKTHIINFEITEELRKIWKTEYKIEVNKNDKKIIRGIEGYRITITEIRQSSIGELIEISEIYVNDKIEIPFNYYEILELKKKIDLSGLILEIKSYDKETPSLFNHYILKNYNLEKQDKSLIKRKE